MPAKTSVEINQLLAAEKKAVERIEQAKRNKLRRLKEAGDEAGKEIEQLQRQHEQQFKSTEADHSGTKDAMMKRVDAETAERLQAMKKELAEHREGIIARILEKVYEIKPSMHENARFEEVEEPAAVAPPTRTSRPAVPSAPAPTGGVDRATMGKLEAAFSKLQAATDSKSLLRKYLTRDVFDRLKNKTTSFGSTLLDVIQSGVENLDSGVGVYAPDAEAYSVFSDLFDPIIEDYHAGFSPADRHPSKDFGNVDSLGNVDPEGEFVISTRVRCGRSMKGYPFNPCLTEAQYQEMQDSVSSTLNRMEGELQGQYYPLAGMTKEVQQKLIDDHFLFKEGDRFLQAANACRFWPTGRGIYHNDDKTFLVWCNEEDHLRIISMQQGGDLGQVYRRLVTAANDIEKRVPFSHHDRLGFLTFCPTNLGTTIRASVHIKVPKLAADKGRFAMVADRYNLQVRGTRGEHTEAEGGVYDISNKRRMGLTEYDAVKEMHDGILAIIEIEKSL